MKIYVTQRDFNEGNERNCSLGPVSIAANRAAMRLGWNWAEVGSTSIRFAAAEGMHTRYCTRQISAKASRFIKNFDRGRLDRLSFKPFYLIVQDIPDLTAGNPG